MNQRQFKTMRVSAMLFVFVTVFLAVVYKNMVLALAGSSIGVLFILLVRGKTKEVLADERTQSIGGQASRLTYAISTIVITFPSLIFIGTGRQTGEAGYEMLGVLLSYIALFNLALYSLSYRYISKRYE
ncbi:MAG: DUF2178 domain-containing protein [Candidatus Pacebacteria bacterium]|nr:DUF2178 domain-containing protein [Candidatus Paceibacterota bacterium]